MIWVEPTWASVESGPTWMAVGLADNRGIAANSPYLQR
jgi:hypothetical protein